MQQPVVHLELFEKCLRNFAQSILTDVLEGQLGEVNQKDWLYVNFSGHFSKFRNMGSEMRDKGGELVRGS